jgi:hypothetical protein
MNIPNNISWNNILDPRNFHFESTYPFREPRTADNIVAGTTRLALFFRLGANVSHAST